MSRQHGPKIITDGLILYLDSTVDRSYSQNITYGPELVTDASVLTAGDGQVKTVSSIGGNYINFPNIAPCVAGKRYRMIWTISARRGTTSVSFGPSTTPSLSGGINLAVGTYSRTFTCNTTGNFSISSDNVGADFDIDYLSIKEITTANSDIWYDLSGNNRHFNIGGAVKENKALYYTSANSNAYESVVNSVPFTDLMTIDMWVKPTSFSNVNSACGLIGYTLFSKQGGFNGPSGPLYTGLRAGYDTLSGRLFFNIAGSSALNIYHNPGVNTNELMNYVMQQIVTPSSQTLLLYVNGELSSSGTIYQSYSHPTYVFNLAGNTNHCGNHSLFGNLYSTKIYNRILSSSEILYNYRNMRSRYL
jgi:hypothetical protein